MQSKKPNITPDQRIESIAKPVPFWRRRWSVSAWDFYVRGAVLGTQLFWTRACAEEFARYCQARSSCPTLNFTVSKRMVLR